MVQNIRILASTTVARQLHSSSWITAWRIVHLIECWIVGKPGARCSSSSSLTLLLLLLLIQLSLFLLSSFLSLQSLLQSPFSYPLSVPSSQRALHKILCAKHPHSLAVPEPSLTTRTPDWRQVMQSARHNPTTSGRLECDWCHMTLVMINAHSYLCAFRFWQVWAA